MKTLKTTGVYSADWAAAGKAFAKTLTRYAKGGFQGFHNNASVSVSNTSYGSVTVTVSGGCRAFHEFVERQFQCECIKVYTK